MTRQTRNYVSKADCNILQLQSAKGGDDRAAADLDGFSPQFASFGGTDGAEEHAEELQADRGGELPRRGRGGTCFFFFVQRQCFHCSFWPGVALQFS